MNLHGIVHGFIIEVRFPNARNAGFHYSGITVSCPPESRFPSSRNQGVIRAGIFTEVPELTRSVLEEIIVQTPTELVIRFLDGTEKTVII